MGGFRWSPFHALLHPLPDPSCTNGRGLAEEWLTNSHLKTWMTPGWTGGRQRDNRKKTKKLQMPHPKHRERYLSCVFRCSPGFQGSSRWYYHSCFSVAHNLHDGGLGNNKKKCVSEQLFDFCFFAAFQVTSRFHHPDVCVDSVIRQRRGRSSAFLRLRDRWLLISVVSPPRTVQWVRAAVTHTTQ